MSSSMFSYQGDFFIPEGHENLGSTHKHKRSPLPTKTLLNSSYFKGGIEALFGHFMYSGEWLGEPRSQHGGNSRRFWRGHECYWWHWLYRRRARSSPANSRRIAANCQTTTCRKGRHFLCRCGYAVTTLSSCERRRLQPPRRQGRGRPALAAQRRRALPPRPCQSRSHPRTEAVPDSSSASTPQPRS